MNRTGWLAVGALVGAVLAVSVPESTPALAAASLASAAICAAGLIQTRRRMPVLCFGIGATLVLGRALLGFALAPVADVGRPVSTDASGTRHSGVVLSVGPPGGGLQRVVVELQPPEPRRPVYAWLPRYPQLAPTDAIEFDGRLEAPPTDGEFGEYLARSGISATVRARSLVLVGVDDTPLAALEGVRRTAADLITRVLPEPQAGLTIAMAIGLRDVVSRDVSDDFRTAGLSHVVAISGWHIAMLGAVVAALLSGIPRRPRSVLVLLAIAGYAMLAGASPGILRAAVMASVVILARESGRRGQAASALALTCLALVFLEPATVTDVGFELSAAATAGLLAWAAPLRDSLARRLPRATPHWLLEALAVSLAAQLATLPIVLFHFGRLSTVAPLANLLVAPLVVPAMLVTAVCFAAGAAVALGAPAIALAPITLVGAVVIGSLISVASISASLPYANVVLPEPVNLVAAVASGVAMLVIMQRRRRRRSAAVRAAPPPVQPRRRPAALLLTRTRLIGVGGAVMAVVLLGVVVSARPDGGLHVTVLDVGQGDATLLQGPSGGRILIDTGPDPDRLLTLLDARVPAWDRRIDVVVLTHPHEDHVAGLALLLRRYRIGEVVEPGMIGPGPGDAAYRRELNVLGRTSRVVAAGDRLWLDGIELHVNWPRPGSVPLRPADSGTGVNNVSIVLDLRFGERRMLFTGDIEEEIDPEILANGLAQRLGGAVDLLKVAHHGSATATTDSFVTALEPRVAVVSAGLGNPYGHPSPRTMERLSKAGAQLFRTDLDGNVTITTDGADLIATKEGGRPPPPRRSPSLPPGIGFCPLPVQSAGRWPARRGRRTYNRTRASPHTRRGCGHREDPRAARVAAAALDRGGRDRRVPVHRDGRARSLGRWHPGRLGGLPP